MKALEQSIVAATEALRTMRENMCQADAAYWEQAVSSGAVSPEEGHLKASLMRWLARW